MAMLQLCRALFGVLFVVVGSWFLALVYFIYLTPMNVGHVAPTIHL